LKTNRVPCGLRSFNSRARLRCGRESPASWSRPDPDAVIPLVGRSRCPSSWRGAVERKALNREDEIGEVSTVVERLSHAKNYLA
jgi:hypothetical protein